MDKEIPDMVVLPMKDLLDMEDALEAPTFEDVKVIAYKPQIANFLGSIECAIYFQQLCHWSKYAKREDGLIYKSAKEIYEETYVSEKIQRRCRDQLVKLGWIEVEKKMANGHPTYHFRVLVKTFGVLMPTGQRPHGTVPIGQRPVPIGQTASSITKNTTLENTYTSEERAKASDLHRLYVLHYKYHQDPQTKRADLDDTQRSEIFKKHLANYRLTEKRLPVIVARIRDAGYDMCAKAIVNSAKDPWNHGENDRAWKADLTKYLLRNYDMVEEWANK